MWWIPRLETPWSELLDIFVVALLAYGAIVTLRGARAHLALVGMAILGAFYLLAQQIGLMLTASIFQAFFAVFLLLLVIIFQAELRQVFERLAVFGLLRERTRIGEGGDQILVSALSRLAESRTGALIVIAAQDPVERHVRGGIPLDGRLSEPLLLSIFDTHSPGHDGAVIVRGDRVERFAVHLPLSANVAQLRNRGTRHAAALGLSERTDALCLIVSEERGQVSSASRGQLIELRNAAAIAERLRQFNENRDPGRAEGRGWLGALRELGGNWREAATALGLAVLLWVLAVPGSEVVQRSLPLPIQVVNLPEDLVLESVDPPRVQTVFSGLRRDFFFLDEAELTVRLDADIAKQGRRTFQIDADSVEHPPELRVVRLNPGRLRISVRAKDAVTPPSGGGTGSAGSE